MTIIGGVIAAVVSAVALAAVIAAFIINRHRKLEQRSDMFEELNPIDNDTSSITYNNVLRNLDMSDDPFEDDFDQNSYWYFIKKIVKIKEKYVDEG